MSPARRDTEPVVRGELEKVLLFVIKKSIKLEGESGDALA